MSDGRQYDATDARHEYENSEAYLTKEKIKAEYKKLIDRPVPSNVVIPDLQFLMEKPYSTGLYGGYTDEAEARFYTQARLDKLGSILATP